MDAQHNCVKHCRASHLALRSRLCSVAEYKHMHNIFEGGEFNDSVEILDARFFADDQVTGPNKRYVVGHLSPKNTGPVAWFSAKKLSFTSPSLSPPPPNVL